MPRRWKEQGSKEKTAFRLSSYSAVKPQAAKCIFIVVVVWKSDCGPGKSGVMQSQSMPRQPSDGRVLAELRLNFVLSRKALVVLIELFFLSICSMLYSL